MGLRSQSQGVKPQHTPSRKVVILDVFGCSHISPESEEKFGRFMREYERAKGHRKKLPKMPNDIDQEAFTAAREARKPALLACLKAGDVRVAEIREALPEQSETISADLQTYRKAGLVTLRGRFRWNLSAKGRAWLEGASNDNQS